MCSPVNLTFWRSFHQSVFGRMMIIFSCWKVFFLEHFFCIVLSFFSILVKLFTVHNFAYFIMAHLHTHWTDFKAFIKWTCNRIFSQINDSCYQLTILHLFSTFLSLQSRSCFDVIQHLRRIVFVNKIFKYNVNFTVFSFRQTCWQVVA